MTIQSVSRPTDQPAEEEAELIAEEYEYDRYGQYGVVHSVKMIGVKEM